MLKAGSKRKKYTAPALEKGLDVIELLANKPQQLTLSEIAAELDRSTGEVFRMIIVLEQRGYLAYDPAAESYGLTLKLFELTHRHVPVRRLTAAAIPAMQMLVRELEQSCHLAVYYNGKCLIVAQEESPGPSGFNVRLGSEVRLLNSCSGHVMLAFSDEETRRFMLSELPAAELRKIKKPDMEKTLAQIRKNGYECVDSAITHGVKDIGFPVYNHTGKAIAALTIPFLERIDGSQKINLGGATRRLSEAAARISSAMGYIPEN